MTRPLGRLGREDALPLFLLGASLLLAFGPVLFGPWIWAAKDHGAQSIGAWHWAQERWRQGLDAAWCGAHSLGYPLADEGQIGAWYPPVRLLALLVDAPRLPAAFVVLHLALFGAGCHVLLRWAGLERWPAFGAALLAQFSGPLSGAYLFSDLAAPAWVPWLLAGLLRLARQDGRGWGAAVLAGAAAAFCAHGHPALAVYGLLSAALLFAVWALGQGAQPWRVLGPRLACAALVFSLLAAGQLRGLSRYTAQSVRQGGLSAQEAAVNALAPSALLQVGHPYLFGDGAKNTFLGSRWAGGASGNLGMLVFVGWPMLALALLGWRQRPAEAAWWMGLALFWTLYALGRFGGIQPWLGRIPPFILLRAPAKAMIYLGLWLLLPAAWGLQGLASASRTWGLALAGSGGLSVAGAAGLWAGGSLLLVRAGAQIRAAIGAGRLRVYSYEVYLGKMEAWMQGLRWHLVEQGLWLLAAGAAFLWLRRRPALLLPVCLLLAAAQARHVVLTQDAYPASVLQAPWTSQAIQRPKGPGEPSRLLGLGYHQQLLRAYPSGWRAGEPAAEARLGALLRDNRALLYGLESARAYSPAGLRRLAPFPMQLDDESPDAPPVSALLEGRQGWLDRLGVRWVLCAEAWPAGGKPLREEDGLRLYERRTAAPLARLVGRWALEPDPAAAARKAGALPLSTVVLEAPPALVVAPLQAGDRVELLSREDQAWRLRSQSQGPRLLVLASAWYEGPWQATVDGAPARLQPVDGMLTGLALPAGAHEVLFEYRDPGARAARAAQALGLLLCALAVLAALRPASPLRGRA